MDLSKELREGTYEGVPHPTATSEINNKALHLIYQTHIPKDRYRQWFNDCIMSQYCKKGKLEFLEIAHEGPDSTNYCDHTHVVILVSKVIRSRNRRIFDWPCPRSVFADESGNLIPRVLVLKRADEIESAKHMLGDEDPEYADYHDKYSKYRKRRYLLMSLKVLLDADGDCLDCLPRIKNPRYKVPHLVRWQKQAHSSMYMKVPQRLNYVYDHTSGSGKMALLTALKNKDPIGCRIILNGPNLQKTIYTTPTIMDDEWNGSVLILNTMVERHTTIPQGLVRAFIKAGDDSSCINTMWIFSNSLPTSLDTMDVSRIDFYLIHSSPTEKIISDLQRLTYDEAVTMWQNRGD